MLISPSGIVVAISKKVNLGHVVVLEKRVVKSSAQFPLMAALNCDNAGNSAAFEFLKGDKAV